MNIDQSEQLRQVHDARSWRSREAEAAIVRIMAVERSAMKSPAIFHERCARIAEFLNGQIRSLWSLPGCKEQFFNDPATEQVLSCIDALRDFHEERRDQILENESTFPRRES